MTRKTLSLADVDRRISQIDEEILEAQKAFDRTALAEATDTGTAKETSDAKDALAALKDKRAGLAAARRQSIEDEASARKKRAAEAHAEFVSSVSANLKERAKLVAAIVDLSDQLGAKLKAHFDIQDKLRHEAHSFVRDFRKDIRGHDGADGFRMALGLGHDIRLVVGATIDANHDVKLTHWHGDRHTLRGDDATKMDARFAEKVLASAEFLKPPKGGE